MGEYETGETIDPVEAGLDPATIRAMQHAIRGFSDTAPPKPRSELSDYRTGRHTAFSAMMAILTSWLEEINTGEAPKNCDG